MVAQVESIQKQVLPPVIPDLFPARSRPAATLRTREDFVRAARELVPTLKANARKCNELRRPVDEVVDAIVQSGVLGLLRPRAYGGAGLEVSDMAEIAGILAEGCPSTAWDYDVWEAHNWIIGMLPQQGQEEVFGTDNLVICCGVSNPTQAKARAVEGGYMLSGRWAFGSGSTHSNWASVGAVIEGRQVNGRPESRFMLVPRPAFCVLDTWRVRGLAGTGTHDIYVADEVFVPEHRTLTRADLVAGTTPGGKLHGTAAYQLPLIPAVHLVTAATAIGVTRATIDAFKEWTSKRVHVSGQKQLDMAAPTIRLGKALIDLEAAELLLQNALHELEAEVRAGRTLTVEQRSKARMVAGYVPDLCKQVVNSLVSASGIGAMDERSPFSGALIDVTMMSLHQSTEYDRGPENYGRVVLGLPPSNPII